MVADRKKRTGSDELLHLAIRAAKGGNKDGARVMFRQLYNRDKRSEQALLWLAKIARNQNERTQWLERLLEVDPENETARKAIARMNYQREAVENRTLLLFGGAAVIMLIMTGFIIAIAFLT